MHATHPHSSIRDSVHAHNPPRIGMYQLINDIKKAGPLFTMGGCTLFPWYGYVVDAHCSPGMDMLLMHTVPLVWICC